MCYSHTLFMLHRFEVKGGLSNALDYTIHVLVYPDIHSVIPLWGTCPKKQPSRSNSVL